MAPAGGSGCFTRTGIKMKKQISTRGAMFEMDRFRSCSMDSCENAAVAILAQQDLCLDHFLSQCYGYFDLLDARRRGPRLGATDLALTKTFVEECSRQALDVSLRCPNMSNLQRGRLLDILLWAGEFFVVLRTSWVSFADNNLAKERETTGKQFDAHV